MSDPRAHSQKKIPFSWEKKPGVCKEKDGEGLAREEGLVPKLPPPPCTTEGTTRNSTVDFQIPLPPCPFQPPYYRTSSKKGLIWVQDNDPFLTAYKECTKSVKNSDNSKNSSKTEGIQSRLRKSFLIFSCKRSCTVRDNNLVRIDRSTISHCSAAPTFV